VRELQRGDALSNGAAALAVVAMHVPAKARLFVVNGVRTSPWHPIAVANSHWHFPASALPVFEQRMDFLYNAILSYSHVIAFNGVRCTTLAHGVVGHPVHSHPFLGSQAVMSSLRSLLVTACGRIYVRYGLVRDENGR
jgi:hypothetical protein